MTAGFPVGAGNKGRSRKTDMIKAQPEGTTWDDLMYGVYVRQKIEKGMEAADEGRVLSHDEVRR